jgi:hypothetical protein
VPVLTAHEAAFKWATNSLIVPFVLNACRHFTGYSITLRCRPGRLASTSVTSWTSTMLQLRASQASAGRGCPNPPINYTTPVRITRIDYIHILGDFSEYVHGFHQATSTEIFITLQACILCTPSLTPSCHVLTRLLRLHFSCGFHSAVLHSYVVAVTS